MNADTSWIQNKASSGGPKDWGGGDFMCATGNLVPRDVPCDPKGSFQLKQGITFIFPRYGEHFFFLTVRESTYFRNLIGLVTSL